jgi:phosphohistidine phosphatase
MPKELLLIRHAKSDWSISGQKDIDRQLNSRGLFTAPKVGRWLAEKGVRPDAIYSSTASRAHRTAELVAEQLGIDIASIQLEESIYEASPRNLLEFINKLNNNDNYVVVFGHNPGFTYIAEYLTGAVVENIPTCGCVLIRFDLSNWAEVSKDSGSLVWEYFPEGRDS